MKKVTLLGASWCPVTQATKKLFEELKKEVEVDWQYIDIDTDEGKKLVDKFSVTDVPKIIVGDKIVFHGQPSGERLIQLINRQSNG